MAGCIELNVVAFVGTGIVIRNDINFYFIAFIKLIFVSIFVANIFCRYVKSSY